MTFSRIILFFLFAGMFLQTACKKDEATEPEPDLPTNPGSGNNPPPPTGNAIKIDFENVVGSIPLTLGPTYLYQNANGDSFSVSNYKYYISHVKLRDANNNIWTETESYHLISQGDTNLHYFYLRDVPAVNYIAMEFTIGVDSARNSSGTQTGALDPNMGMFWTWSTGYIMAKIEGKSASSPAGNNRITFHCGGYSGQYNSIRYASPSFNSQQAMVTANTVPVVTIQSDVLSWFASPNVIDFSQTYNETTPNTTTNMLADNYADMFTVINISN
ncbi:MAG: MbnP family protein [Bacteroidia bacterium]